MAQELPAQLFAPAAQVATPNVSTPEGMAQYQANLDAAVAANPQAEHVFGQGAVMTQLVGPQTPVHVLPAAWQPPVAPALVLESPTAPAKKTRTKKAPAGQGAQVAQISPELMARLETKRARFAGLLAQLQPYPVDTQEQFQNLVDTAADCKVERDGLILEKESITKPLNAALTATRRIFDPPIKFLESCETLIKSKLEARLAAQRAAQDRALTEVAQGRVSHATMQVATGQELLVAAEGSYTIEHWSAEVVDPTLLPMSYWIPNVDMLNDLAKRHKGQIQVPGVRFIRKETIAIRRDQASTAAAPVEGEE